MTISEMMLEKNYSVYKLSKNSGVPYTTLNDICSGKAKLQKCSAETVFKISKELGVSMEQLLTPCFEERISFELFKSNVCHKLKKLGDIDFIIDTLENDEISKYYEKKWHAECLYLLAMLDYVSNINDVPLCTKYNSLRKMKLSKTIYPSSVTVLSAVSKSADIKKTVLNNAISEFLRFNIVENEVRNVI